MKINRLLALILIAALVIGAMGLLTYRSYAQGQLSGASSECIDDDDADESGEDEEIEDADECEDEDASENETEADESGETDESDDAP